MKRNEVIAKIAGIRPVYPNGTKVSIINYGKAYTRYSEAFALLGFKDERFNGVSDYSGVWTVTNKVQHESGNNIMYHIVNGDNELLIDADGIREYIEQ